MDKNHGLTVKQVAERLGLNPSRIYQLINEGTLPSFRHPVFNRVLVPESALETYQKPPRGNPNFVKKEVPEGEA